MIATKSETGLWVETSIQPDYVMVTGTANSSVNSVSKDAWVAAYEYYRTLDSMRDKPMGLYLVDRQETITTEMKVLGSPED